MNKTRIKTTALNPSVGAWASSQTQGHMITYTIASDLFLLWDNVDKIPPHTEEWEVPMRDLASHEHEARVENMEAEPINLDWKVKLVLPSNTYMDMM